MKQGIIQLFVRFAVAIAFLSAVADRIGLWGGPGTENATWGDWSSFLEYSNELNFFAPDFLKEPFALIATILEVVFALMLMIGYKTKIAAILSGLLLIVFAFTMSITFGIKSTFTYSVWIGAGACFLLSEVKNYDFSLDKFLKNEKEN